jgi:hypothetical protein
MLLSSTREIVVIEERDDRNPLAACAALVAATLGNPIDLLYLKSKKHGSSALTSNACKTQGIYRPSPPFLYSTFGNALLFCGAQITQNTFGNHFMSNAMSGFSGQMVGSVVWAPAELYKEIIIKSEYNKTPALQVARAIYNAEGLRYLEKRYFSQLATFGPFHAVAFAGSNELHQRYAPGPTPILTSLAINGFSFGLATALLNAGEIIKNNASTMHPTYLPGQSFFTSAKKIMKDQGAGALLRGTGHGTALLGIRQACALTVFRKVHTELTASDPMTCMYC